MLLAEEPAGLPLGRARLRERARPRRPARRGGQTRPRRPLPAALVTLVVLVIVFSLLLMAGPPTQWFS